MGDYVGIPPREADSIEVFIQKAENGYICTVTYPKHLVPNPALEQAQDIFASLGKMQAGAGGGPEDIVKMFGATINKLKKPNKPLRKLHETYIFQNMETMLQFIKETFEFEEHKNEAAAS